MLNTWLLIKVVLILVGIIIVFSLLQFFLSIHPPRFYDKTIPADLGLAYEPVSFQTKDEVTIKGWLLPSKTAKGTVIVGHGYPFDKGNILPVVTFLHPEYNLLLYDHRYFGESGGSVTTAGVREVADVAAAVAFIQKKFGKQEPLALYGFSLSASAMLMTPVPVKAIIADSPYATLERMVEHIYALFGPFKYPFVKVTIFLSKVFLQADIQQQAPAVTVKKTTVPILLIHGEKDSQIPVDNAYSLKKANPKIDLWIVPGADHGYAYALHKKEYEQRVKTFLKKHMAKK